MLDKMILSERTNNISSPTSKLRSPTKILYSGPVGAVPLEEVTCISMI